LKLLVVAVGHRMPSWVDEGVHEYARRVPEMRLEQVKAEPRPSGSAARGAVVKWLAAEASRIEACIPRAWLKVALDERGVPLATRALAERLRRWETDARDVAFVIGGPDGLADSIKQGADLQWSLSPLTLPHGLVRVIVAEQLYRAHSILKNHPYHRD
jgi:23S rRNA (pseudouridine1915-N3)-methyltransferase